MMLAKYEVPAIRRRQAARKHHATDSKRRSDYCSSATSIVQEFRVMTPKALLNLCNLGSSVAEFDSRLQEYFLETQVYRDFVAGKIDIVSGDKGTGKSAIFRILRDRYKLVPELRDVEIIPGFNEKGNPVFQRLTQSSSLPEGQYITVWKGFVLSAVGNWLLDLAEGADYQDLAELDRLLQALGLRSREKSPTTIFSLIANFLRTIASPKSAELTFSLTETGWPVVAPKLEFHHVETTTVEGQRIVYSEDALRFLDSLLKAHELEVWFVLDRLDEAFAGFPQIEVPALRALFRTFLDFNEFDNIKLKLFVRSDLFRRIVGTNFVNLTHVNARKIEIRWSDEDLKSMLCSRFRDNKDFIHALDAVNSSDDELFQMLFPDQVDAGSRKPKTWQWILTRIRDGNGIKPPRNLIDLINKARDVQARREEREGRSWRAGQSLFEPDALRKALEALSDQRLNDTLLAENSAIVPFIEKFREGKAEHNDESLRGILGVADGEFEQIKKELLFAGFLEQVGSSYKIPMLYRGGLRITQGKGFSEDDEE
jgi:hypothetical protein